MQNAGLEADIFEVMGQSQDQDHLRKNLKNLPAPLLDRTTSTEHDSLSFFLTIDHFSRCFLVLSITKSQDKTLQIG